MESDGNRPRSVARHRPPRADARRNVEVILVAAERCLSRDPDASMAKIAAEAGLDRVTVYAHFKTRAELVEQVARRVLTAANEVLRGLDLSGDPAEALERLVSASWEVTARSGTLLVAAEKALPSRLVRQVHAGELEERVHDFLERGQRAGAFRADLTTDWLVAMFHNTLHAAAAEIAAGRLPKSDAAQVITATLLNTYQALPPPSPRKKAARKS